MFVWYRITTLCHGIFFSKNDIIVFTAGLMSSQSQIKLEEMLIILGRNTRNGKKGRISSQNWKWHFSKFRNAHQKQIKKKGKILSLNAKLCDSVLLFQAMFKKLKLPFKEVCLSQVEYGTNQIKENCQIVKKTKSFNDVKWSRFGVFIINFEHVLYLVLVVLLLTLNKAASCSTVYFITIFY